jgi:uncharacterized protein
MPHARPPALPCSLPQAGAIGIAGRRALSPERFVGRMRQSRGPGRAFEMSHFRLLTRSRQVTEYSCGACALQAVLSHWGSDVEEEDLMRILATSSEVGTYPEDIVRGARSLGFEAEAKENLTLDEVERFTAEGHPMIALGQFWLSEREMAASLADEWETGHYIVVLGVDKEYVYFQDPFVRMSKAFVPRKTFEEHWHQVMGGKLETNPKLVHLGIFVRGKASAERPVAGGLTVPTLDFEKFGSLNLMVVQFPRILRPYDFIDELKDIWADGNVRPDAFIFLRKDGEGNVTGMEGSRLTEDDDIASVNAVLAAIVARSIGSPEQARSKVEAATGAAAAGDFGLSADDIHLVARKLSPGHSAIIVLFENVWERKFKAVAHKHGGALVSQRLLTSEALAKAADELRGKQ